MAGGEGIETLGPPGTEEGAQGHLGLGSPLRAGTAADFATDDQMAQAAFSGVVVWRHLRVSHEDEEFLDVVLHASTQLGLGLRRVVEEGLADGQQSPFQDQLSSAPLLL